MESLKRLFSLAAGIILGAKLAISYKENGKRQKEYRNLIARGVDFQEYKLSGEKND